MPSLIIKNDKGKRHIPLHGVVSIGRHPKNSLCIDESEISKYHAKIHSIDGEYVFEDLGSSNGSYFNELKVKKHTFSDGDTIRLGHTHIIFKDKVSSEKDVRSLVVFEQFEGDGVSDIQERIQLDKLEKFNPESEVSDVNLLRVDYEKLRMGQNLLQHIGLERNIEKLLQSISEQLIPMFGADRCVVLLSNSLGEFETKSVHSLDTLDSPITVSKSVLQEVKASKSAVLLSTTEKADEIAQVSSLMLMDISSVMCSPIIYNDEVIGAIHLDLGAGNKNFVKKDLHLLGAISSYVAMAVANAELITKTQKEADIKSQFERLLSPNVVKQLVSGKLNIGQAGELRYITIMYIDIRGFTHMSMSSSPQSVVKLLNNYFDKVVEVVFKYGGTVDKFMGDAVMVLFGAPIPMKQQADAAISCALEVQAMLTIWNKERAKAKQEVIPVGIGINSGEVVVGSIGSSKTMQYTCVGSAVNIASRLTSMAKEGQIIASHDVIDRLESKVNYNALPPRAIKGVEENIQTYEILSFKTNG